jgi:hypothetical protein
MAGEIGKTVGESQPYWPDAPNILVILFDDVGFSGLNNGRDRSSPVSHDEAPFAFTGQLRRITLDARASATLARE